MILGGKEQKAAKKLFFQDTSMEGPLPLGQVGVLSSGRRERREKGSIQCEHLFWHSHRMAGVCRVLKPMSCPCREVEKQVEKKQT